MKAIRFAILIGALSASANLFADDWQNALNKMPLASAVTELDRSNCVPLLLNSFQSNGVVKALIFMPGATDEIYFFRRVHVQLSKTNASLADAIIALTNQTYVQADFRPPFLILHTTEDSLDVIADVKNKSTADKLRQRTVSEKILLNDADWDEVHEAIGKFLNIGLRPREGSPDSWHFYRHSFVADGVTQWELLETLALAGKTTFSVHWLTADFEPDRREGPAPKLEKFPAR
jgi:hypothetical protein